VLAKIFGFNGHTYRALFYKWGFRLPTAFGCILRYLMRCPLSFPFLFFFPCIVFFFLGVVLAWTIFTFLGDTRPRFLGQQWAVVCLQCTLLGGTSARFWGSQSVQIEKMWDVSCPAGPRPRS